jgi:hypothetical protein
VDPDLLDVTADGSHAYAAHLGDRTVRVVVEDATLAEIGLTAAEEPLLVRRTLELLPGDLVDGLGDQVTLAELGTRVEGWPLTATARLRA